ncbi:uncharacterized protein LOC108875522 isoform X2 [Lates calcarifer]|uniref:Uncharacterized protein LOC108875522 isoform X2 n=1 Tax=Lates calcarifer TaxID=8187 RepID=A0AAJ8DN80_LATCA|nr:uncharacterized protein LOC108875522 isoform X2 [Lates calcarifer]
MDQRLNFIPEELQNNFPPGLLKAANSLVEDYTQRTHNTNLHDFFSLLKDFVITVKKKKDSHTRTPGRVKVFSLVTGQTCGADVTILKKVKNCRGITVEETNHWDQCDVIIVFCPISGRPGSDVQDAMSRVQGDSPVILVLMHHTRKPDHAAGATNWFETYPQVVLDVDVLFHDSVPGLLQCERNENTVQQIHRELMERGGSQERGDVDERKSSILSQWLQKLPNLHLRGSKSILKQEGVFRPETTQMVPVDEPSHH